MTRIVSAFFLLLAVIALAGIVAAIVRPYVGSDVSDADLARRVDRARVVWEDYGEDIKAALGATPAAHWHGAPVGAGLVEAGIEVSFELSGLWAAYDFGAPILVRTPEGEVLSSYTYARMDGGGVYTFRHPAPLNALNTPWIELRFPPNEERRLVFDDAGVWRAPGAP